MVRLNSIIRYALFAALLLLITGCPEEIPEDDMEVIIINQSMEKIVFWAPMSKSNINPDTTLPLEFPWGSIEDIYEEDIVDSNSNGSTAYNSDNLQHILGSGWVHYHILIYDSLISIPWERIRDEYIVAKRVDFNTWEDLESADFTVTYP